MTSARKACLLRFLFWIILAWIMRINLKQFSQEEFLAILAMFEVIIGSSFFLDNKK